MNGKRHHAITAHIIIACCIAIANSFGDKSARPDARSGL
jgi:hypothetical protein